MMMVFVVETCVFFNTEESSWPQRPSVSSLVLVPAAGIVIRIVKLKKKTQHNLYSSFQSYISKPPPLFSLSLSHSLTHADSHTLSFNNKKLLLLSVDVDGVVVVVVVMMEIVDEIGFGG